MAESVRIGLDNPAFYGRLKRPDFSHPINRPVPLKPSRNITPNLNPRPIVRPRPLKANIPTNQNASKIYYQPQITTQQINLQPVNTPLINQEYVEDYQSFPKTKKSRLRLKKPNYSKTQWALVSMATVVLFIGLAVSYQSFLTNHNAAAQISELSKKVDQQSSGSGNSVLPSTTKPSAKAVSDYAVAPDLPKYIRIPKIGVFARVLQVGVTTSGALGTPPDVYDTAWYTGSSKPGQPGATLIDGHVSSWTSKGVFYSIKNLSAGDFIQIQKGDNTFVDYQVVKTEVFDADNVDMQAAITPIDPTKPGLNLITCTGQVIKGTSLFNKRVIVFAVQTS